MKTLEKYEKSVMQVIDEFCKKQGCSFDYWVGGVIGEVGAFGDNFFNFTDVYIDLKQNAPAGLIFEWQNADIEFNINRKKPININYRSYIMGLRFKEKTKKSTYDWLLKNNYINKDGFCNLHLDNVKIRCTDKKFIEIRFAFDNNKECNVIYNPTKKEVKKAIHLFGTSVITEL